MNVGLKQGIVPIMHPSCYRITITGRLKDGTMRMLARDQIELGETITVNTRVW